MSSARAVRRTVIGISWFRLPLIALATLAFVPATVAQSGDAQQQVEASPLDGSTAEPAQDSGDGAAQERSSQAPAATTAPNPPAAPPIETVGLGAADEVLLSRLNWRSLGPRVGGRLLPPGPLAVDERFPPRLFSAFDGAGGLTVEVPRLGDSGDPRWRLAVPLAPGRAVPSPRNDDRVYGSADHGIVLRYDADSDELRAVSVWPDLPLGPEDPVLYRFHPRAPLFFSPHDGDALYVGGNLLFQTTDGGLSWAAVSPDLAPTGGALTAALELPLQTGVFWTGGSDGRVHLSQDFGESWLDRGPRTFPAGTEIRSLDPHPTNRAGLYLAAGAPGDPEARVLRTFDWGGRWENAASGLDGPAWVVRADPERAGLLYAGVARGARVSFDDGRSWLRLPGLPDAAVVDLRVGAGGLLAAVQGAGIWQLPDLAPLRQWNRTVAASAVHLFEPAPAIRRQGLEPGSAALWLWLRQSPASDDASLEILDGAGQPVRSFNAAVTTAPPSESGTDGATLPLPGAPFAPAPGLSLFLWDLRFPGPTVLPGEEAPSGPPAPPGNYLVRFTVGDDSVTAQLPVLADPRSTASADAQRAGFDYLITIRDLRSRLRDALLTIDNLPATLPSDASSAVQPDAEARSQLSALRGATESPSPGTLWGLDRKLAHLAAGHQGVLDRPTESALAVLARLDEDSQQLLQRAAELLSPVPPAVEALTATDLPVQDAANDGDDEGNEDAVDILPVRPLEEISPTPLEVDAATSENGASQDSAVPDTSVPDTAAQDTPTSDDEPRVFQQ